MEGNRTLYRNVETMVGKGLGDLGAQILGKDLAREKLNLRAMEKGEKIRVSTSSSRIYDLELMKPNLGKVRIKGEGAGNAFPKTKGVTVCGACEFVPEMDDEGNFLSLPPVTHKFIVHDMYLHIHDSKRTHTFLSPITEIRAYDTLGNEIDIRERMNKK